jgi:Mor family transcriptional regulator
LRLFAKAGHMAAQLSKRFKISANHVRAILARENWGHI